MPRTARRKSESSIYHIMARGINHQDIFTDRWDKEKYLNILARYREKIEFDVYAYCLMNNHVHLLIREGNEELSNTMKRIGTSYVYWYNWQYNRKGHLFQDRFRSEPVENEVYFLAVLRYIHQNPVKAGLSREVGLYPWSSYREYTSKKKLVDVDYALSLFDENRDIAVARFKAFNGESNQDQCLEMAEQVKTLSDREVKLVALEKYGVELAFLQQEPPETQREVLRYLRGMEGCSIRQLSHLSGIHPSRIYRASNNPHKGRGLRSL